MSVLFLYYNSENEKPRPSNLTILKFGMIKGFVPQIKEKSITEEFLLFYPLKRDGKI